MSKPFNIIIDCSFVDINTTPDLKPIDNKRLFGLANTFEDGIWDYNKFYKFLWNNIEQTALTQKERNSLFDEHFSILSNSVQKLRLTKDGGEIGEICLYAVMKNYYNAISVVPKLFYKQNNNDPAKGADSVHIVIENEDSFSLWFGEAKFYNNIEDARLYEILESVHNVLKTDKIKKENSIITNLNEISESPEISDKMKAKILTLLNESTSIDEIKPLLHIPILLLYQCEITKTETHFTVEYKDTIENVFKERANSYFKKQIKKCKDIDMYSSIQFHLILLPVPDKEKIVKDFTEKANALR